MIYIGHRFYHPRLGRFINRDPIGEVGGRNLYAMTGNDYANQTDVLGLSPTIEKPMKPEDINFGNSFYGGMLEEMKITASPVGTTVSMPRGGTVNVTFIRGEAAAGPGQSQSNSEWQANEKDCDELYSKYPQADRPAGHKFNSMDDAALGSYLYVLEGGQGTMWGHSTSAPSPGTSRGLEWGAEIFKHGIAARSGSNGRVTWSFSEPHAGGADYWNPRWRSMYTLAAMSHTHAHVSEVTVSRKSPSEGRLYFSGEEAGSDVSIVNRYNKPMYLLNAAGELMKLNPPAVPRGEGVPATPFDDPVLGPPELLQTIPREDLWRLHECAQAGFRRT